MNEKVTYFLTAAFCWVCAIVVFFLGRHFGKRGTRSNNSRVEELERRAAGDNSKLSEAERRTSDIIREQAEDNRRAESNNRRASELIQRAEEIINKNTAD